jgi:hypothetical protein
MEETKAPRTGSQRVKDWRLRYLRKVYWVEVLLSAEEETRLTISLEAGMGRAAFLRGLIKKSWGKSYPVNDLRRVLSPPPVGLPRKREKPLRRGRGR